MARERHPEPVILTGEPGGLGTMVRAALPSVPGLNLLPGVRKSTDGDAGRLSFQRPAVLVEREHVDRYAAVCGFPVKDTVPLPYPHMLAFGLHMAIMTDPTFPYPAIGSVHVENSITSHRPIHVGETLTVTARATEPAPHAKGMTVDFVTEVSAGADVVWESTSTYLRRTRPAEGTPRAGLTLPSAPRGTAEWHLPGDLGRRYGAVSGDRNPIHLYPLTAKAFGFPRQIAHGMWSLARCVAAFENRLPDAVRVDVAFKKPILLPGTVAFGLVERPDSGPHDLAFALTRPKDGAPHLVGVTTAL